MSTLAKLLAQRVLQLAVSSREAETREAAVRVFEEASEEHWDLCVMILDEHRLLGLAYHALFHQGLLAYTPEPIARGLKAHYDHAVAANGLALMTLHGVCAKLRGQGIEPVACKGVVLASRYYPDRGMRRMNDIDLWIDAADSGKAHEVLEGLGFRRLLDKSLPDGENYRNAMGVTFDVHSRMRLFEVYPGGYRALSRPLEHGAFRVFEPHAMLAHLCSHMAGHFRETGPMLCWLLDLGMVLQRHGDELDPARVRGLLTRSNWVTLLRTVRFLEEELQMRLPPSISAAAQHVEPFRFDTVLRLRRLSIWQLPRPVGWLRLCACLLHVAPPGERPWPSLQDLALWPRDHAQHWWATTRQALSPRQLRPVDS